MQQSPPQPPPSTPLDYAAPSRQSPRPFFNVSAAAVACITIAWLLYVQFARPRYHVGDALWDVLWKTSGLPGGIGITLAVIGLARRERRRMIAVAAVVIILAAYALLPPPMNFA